MGQIKKKQVVRRLQQEERRRIQREKAKSNHKQVEDAIFSDIYRSTLEYKPCKAFIWLAMRKYKQL